MEIPAQLAREYLFVASQVRDRRIFAPTKCSAMAARPHHRVGGALSIVTSRMWFVML